MKKIYVLLLAVLPILTFAQYVENSSFENWETELGKDEPVDWNSIQTGLPANIAALAPKVMSQSTDAHTGMYSIKLTCVSTFGIVATGVASNARFFADFDPTKGYTFTDPTDSRWNTSVSTQPDSLVGWYKYEPSGADITEVKALIHTGEAKVPDVDSTNYIGSAVFPIGNTTVSNWTRFSVPFNYTSSATPEYVMILLSSGNGTNATAGSVAYYDDIELIYNTVSTGASLEEENISVFSFENHINIDLRKIQNNEPIAVYIYDVLGKLVWNKPVQNGIVNVVNELPSGIYICTLKSGATVMNKKVWVQ